MAAAVYCVLCRSNSRENPKYSYFRFPRDAERCLQWKEQINVARLLPLDSETCYKRYRLCNIHFEDSMFSSMMKNKLKKNAFPKLFLQQKPSPRKNWGNTKKPNRNFSLKPTESGINDTDTVNKCNKSNIDEEIIISDSEDDIQSPGKPADLTDNLDLDWIPTLNLGNQITTATLSETKMGKYERKCSVDEVEGGPKPSLDMSDTNIVHITVPSRYSEDSNGFAEFSNSSQFPDEACEDSNSQTYNEILTNSFGQPVVEEEEEYHCRTCLSVTTKSSSVWVTETLILDKNVKDVIIFLVPEMESTLKDEEVVCTSCLEVLKSTMKFIIKCLEVDAILTKEREQMQGVDGSIEKYKDVEIADIKEEEIDEEHDYCGKVISVGDVISTEDVADINEDVTLLEQAAGEANEGDSVELHYENMSYVENNVEIQYEMAEEWLPNNEEDLSEQTVSVQEYESYDEDADVEEIETLSCSTCMESFITKEDYEVHLQVHPPHICETCGETFTKRESLRAHRLTHNDPNSYICEVCGKGFKDYGTLRCHLKEHSDDECTCDKCSKMFKNKRLLDIHMKYVHDKVYDTQCTICGILTKNEVSLKTHMRLVHFKEKPFECNICHKKFGRSDYLHNHKLRHTGEPRIVKPKPEKRKVRTKTRMRYKIQDRGEPVPCKFCGQWYKDIVRLKRHLETHLKRYPCQFCPLTFPRNILCKRHEEIHRGGTVNFSRCNVCWKKFKTKEALDEHVKCHNNPQHFCDLCGKTFNRKFLLSHHKLMEHSNIPDKEQPEEIIYDSLLEVGGLSTELDG